MLRRTNDNHSDKGTEGSPKTVRAAAGCGLQSAALPYRRGPDGQVEVLLITTTTSQNWAIPKGEVAEGHSLASSAAKEAREEAGVIGEIGTAAIGAYRAIRRVGIRGQQVVEVWIFPLKVTQTLENWKERHLREIRWLPADKAAAIVSEPVVADLCRRLALGELNL